jgi:hypothetical protein
MVVLLLSAISVVFNTSTVDVEAGDSVDVPTCSTLLSISSVCFLLRLFCVMARVQPIGLRQSFAFQEK